MDKKPSEMKTGKVMIWACLGWAMVLLLAFLYGQKLHTENVFSSRVKKEEILSRMRVNLIKSVEMEKNAVMAITDEESKVFADQSLKASDAVEADLRQLDLLAKAGNIAEAANLIPEFRKGWDNLREIDKVLLEFAVQNTNLKAASLSYTKGADSVMRFERAINALSEIFAEDVRIIKPASHALISVLKISNLQAPHINAAGNEQMDQIESAMKTEAENVKMSLNALSEFSDERSRALLDEDRAAFAEFLAVNAEIIRLSRQNSNIKSMELSLGRKRKAAAQCEEILSMIQEAVRDRPFKSPR